MNLEQASPAPQLRDYVRCFQQRRAHILGATATYPIAARPDQFLEFYLQDPYIVRLGDAAAPEIVPHSVVVGPCTQLRAQLVLCGKLDVFTIQFRPAGFHRLFRMPMDEFADQAFEARSVIGPKLGDFERKLSCASSFGERASVARAFLIECLADRSGGDAVAAVANRFCLSGARSASQTRRRRLGSACANSSAGLGNRSAFLPNFTLASSGSTPCLKPR
jgi:hypothetical protein